MNIIALHIADVRNRLFKYLRKRPGYKTVTFRGFIKNEMAIILYSKKARDRLIHIPDTELNSDRIEFVDLYIQALNALIDTARVNIENYIHRKHLM